MVMAYNKSSVDSYIGVYDYDEDSELTESFWPSDKSWHEWNV